MELFENRLARGANWDALQVFLQEWCSEQSVQELYEAAQARRIPFAPVSTMGDLLASPHLNARGFFATLDHPAPGASPMPGRARIASRATPWALRRPAPRLGRAHRPSARRARRRRGAAASRGRRAMSRRAPLDGHPRRRLHLGVGRAVLHAPARPPRRRGDPRRDRDAHLRHAPAAAVRGRQPGPNRSGYFNQYNQGKRSLALDLKQPEALEVAKRLCAASDIVVENFAAGVMDRMGLGYEVLRALRPDVIMIALSGYGATGPDHD